MEDPLVARVERALGLPGLAARLAELPGSDLASFLLEVHRRRAAATSPPALLRAYEQSRFARPSPADPAELAALERSALSLLPEGYEAVALSPLEPFGAAAALGAIPQDWVVSAARGTEVAADPTVALALECAARRRAARNRRVDLFAAQRVVRAQPFEPPYRQHFGLIALCSAGRDAGGHRFDTETLVEHVALYLGVAGGGPELRVELTPLAGGTTADRLEERVVRPLAERFPHVRLELDGSRQDGLPGYYVRTCFRVWARRGDGEANLADGGFTDWTARLLGDRKERLLTSGLGTEMLAPSAALE